MLQHFAFNNNLKERQMQICKGLWSAHQRDTESWMIALFTPSWQTHSRVMETSWKLFSNQWKQECVHECKAGGLVCVYVQGLCDIGGQLGGGVTVNCE